MGKTKPAKRDDKGFAKYQQRLRAEGYYSEGTGDSGKPLPMVARRKKKSPPSADEQLLFFIEAAEAYLLYDRLGKPPHRAGNREGVVIRGFGIDDDACRHRQDKAAQWIVDNSQSVAAAFEKLGGDPVAILEIGNLVNDPDHGPPAIRALWSNRKAALQSAMLQGMKQPPPVARLIESHQKVFGTINQNGPIYGKELERITGIDIKTITSHIIPVLRKAPYNVRNKRGLGYYIE